MSASLPYETSRLIYPTPGGAAGDASINGALTVQADNSLSATQPLLMVGSSGVQILEATISPSLLLHCDGQFRADGSVFLISKVARLNGIDTAGLGVPAIYAASNGTGATATVTLSYTPPATAGVYMAKGHCKVTVAGTSTVPNLSYTDEGGAAQSYALKMDEAGTTTFVTSMTATGSYSVVPRTFGTDNSATAVVLTLTPTGSTFDYALELLQTQ